MGGDPYVSARGVGERERTGVPDPYGDRALLTSAMTGAMTPSRARNAVDCGAISKPLSRPVRHRCTPRSPLTPCTSGTS